MKPYAYFKICWADGGGEQESNTVTSHKILRDGTLLVTFARSTDGGCMEWIVPPHGYRWVNFKREISEKSPESKIAS